MKKIYGLILGLFISVGAFGATFNLFTPASGVLKGNPSTYVTTSATSTDVKSLWSGTCDSTSYLRGDGTCATPPGTGGGTVNSVALSAPSVFGVSGSPVTTTGTLALSFATGQTANSFLATPDGTTGALSLRTILNGDLPTVNVAHGGTGVATITGPLKGNGTSAFSAATSADIYGLWSGTCSSGTFLRGDGACAAGSAGTVTSVALTVPSGFSVTGSPVTSSGTLAISGTLNPAAGGTGVATLTGIAKGNGTSAFTTAASGDVIATWGGTCSASTYLRGDGSCQTPATGGTSANPSATIGLTAVNGSASTYLRSDGAPALSQAIAPTWTGSHTFSGAGTRISFTGAGTSAQYFTLTNTGASATIGIDNSTGGGVFVGSPAYSFGLGTNVTTDLSLGTNNTERLRIAAAGNVTINAPSSGGTTLTLNGPTATNYKALGIGGSTTGYVYQEFANTGGNLFLGVDTSVGGVLASGSSAYGSIVGTGNATPLYLATNNSVRFLIGTSGQLGIGGATYGTSGQVLTSGGSSAAPSWTTLSNTCSTGNYSATVTGTGGTPSVTLYYRVCGNIATVWSTSSGTGTSIAGNAGLTGTGAITPTTQHNIPAIVISNNVSVSGCVNANTGGGFTLTASVSCAGGGFTTGQPVGIPANWTITYPLD